MTGSRKSFAVLAALALLLFCGAQAATASATAVDAQAAEVLPPDDLAYAILKTIVFREISGLGDAVLLALQNSFSPLPSFSISAKTSRATLFAPCQGSAASYRGVNT